MPLTLPNPEADRLARALAALTGETVERAVERALRDGLAREQARRADPPGGVGEPERAGPAGDEARLRLTVEPVTAEQAYLARAAYRTYGKGFHPAALNLGDCFAYALSKAAGEPLLFQGGGFARTGAARC